MIIFIKKIIILNFLLKIYININIYLNLLKKKIIKKREEMTSITLNIETEKDNEIKLTHELLKIKD